MKRRCVASSPIQPSSGLRSLIDTDDGPKRLADRMDDWQREDFEVLDPACRRIAGQDVEPPYLACTRACRGHSKTTDIAIVASYMLFASDRKINGVAVQPTRIKRG